MAPYSDAEGHGSVDKQVGSGAAAGSATSQPAGAGTSAVCRPASDTVHAEVHALRSAQGLILASAAAAACPQQVPAMHGRGGHVGQHADPWVREADAVANAADAEQQTWSGLSVAHIQQVLAAPRYCLPLPRPLFPLAAVSDSQGVSPWPHAAADAAGEVATLGAHALQSPCSGTGQCTAMAVHSQHWQHSLEVELQELLAGLLPPQHERQESAQRLAASCPITLPVAGAGYASLARPALLGVHAASVGGAEQQQWQRLTAPVHYAANPPHPGLLPGPIVGCGVGRAWRSLSNDASHEDPAGHAHEPMTASAAGPPAARGPRWMSHLPDVERSQSQPHPLARMQPLNPYAPGAGHDVDVGEGLMHALSLPDRPLLTEGAGAGLSDLLARQAQCALPQLPTHVAEQMLSVLSLKLHGSHAEEVQPALFYMVRPAARADGQGLLFLSASPRAYRGFI